MDLLNFDILGKWKFLYIDGLWIVLVLNEVSKEFVISFLNIYFKEYVRESG